jgi:hypothetical protein
MLITGFGLATFAAMILVAGLLSREELVCEVTSPGLFNDLGNLLLAFVMLWAYMAFSQFLIVWCGDLVEEIPWYLRRTRGGWQFVALALIVFHFFVPFVFLLFREVKRVTRSIEILAASVIVMHLVDLVWLVLPAQAANPLQPVIPWGAVLLVPLTTVAIGGVWVALFLRSLKVEPLIPRHDPAILAAVEHATGGD